MDMHCHKSLHSSKQLVAVMELVNTYQQIALNYRGYRFSDRSQHYDVDLASEIAKMAQRLEVQLKLQVSDGSKPTSIHGDLTAFLMGCNTNGIFRAHLCENSTFPEKTDGVRLNPRICLSSSNCPRVEGRLKSY